MSYPDIADHALIGDLQTAALIAILATLDPSVLALGRPLLKVLPPRPSGYRQTRELFPRYTGQMFDAITPAIRNSNEAAPSNAGFLAASALASADALASPSSARA